MVIARRMNERIYKGPTKQLSTLECTKVGSSTHRTSPNMAQI